MARSSKAKLEATNRKLKRAIEKKRNAAKSKAEVQRLRKSNEGLRKQLGKL
jgi:hypothetical protein